MDDKKFIPYNLALNNMLQESSFLSDIKSENNELVQNINSTYQNKIVNDDENQINNIYINKFK